METRNVSERKSEKHITDRIRRNSVRGKKQKKRAAGRPANRRNKNQIRSVQSGKQKKGTEDFLSVSPGAAGGPCSGLQNQYHDLYCEEGGTMNQNVRQLTASSVRQFESYLHREGKKKSTIEKYLRDVKAFRTWLRHERTAKETEEIPEDTENSAEDTECSDEEAKISDPELCCVFGSGTVTKESARRWRDVLCKRGYAPVTVNAMLTSLNLLFRFLGWEECRAKTLRIQRCFFRSSERELQRREYECLIRTAKAQEKERLALLIETMGATGIRVSEVKAVTVEAVRCGRAEISLKGKIRTILIEEKLRKKLLRYAEKRDIICGEIFVTRSGNSLSRQQIWAEMKRLCQAAGVLHTKVFPHNLRHLFARAFYQVSRDIVKLADVLGHSSLSTTRIYLTSTGEEHARYLARLHLIS